MGKKGVSDVWTILHQRDFLYLDVLSTILGTTDAVVHAKMDSA